MRHNAKSIDKAAKLGSDARIEHRHGLVESDSNVFSNSTAFLLGRIKTST